MSDRLNAIIEKWEFAEPPCFCKCRECGLEWESEDSYTLCEECSPEPDFEEG